MKKLLVFISILGLSFNILAQGRADTAVAPTYSEQELTFLKEQYKILTDKNAEIIEDLKEERKNHQEFVEGIYRWFFAIVAFIGIILVIVGWRTIKDAKKDIRKKIEDVTDKLLKEWNSSLEKLADELHTEPDALKDAIVEKITENELKNYGLIILYKNDEKEKAKEMEKLLCSSGFRKVKRIQYKEFIESDLSESDVIILFSNLTDDTFKEKIEKSGCAILGCGKQDEIEIKNIETYAKNKNCVTCCNSFATLYQNLISLLYYRKETLSQ
jgi:PleD family two-component response regulator